jgi:hypothetical protein
VNEEKGKLKRLVSSDGWLGTRRDSGLEKGASISKIMPHCVLVALNCPELKVKWNTQSCFILMTIIYEYSPSFLIGI